MVESNLPDINSDVWEEIINGRKAISFDFLAANILTQHFQDLYANGANKEDLQIYALQLRELFVRNSELPSVKNDIYKINRMVS